LLHIEWSTAESAPVTTLLWGTPGPEHVGEHEVILKASDGVHATRQSFLLTVRPAEPGDGPYRMALEESAQAQRAASFEEVPSDFTLLQNYPNPFNASTQIEYTLPEARTVHLAVYDVLGRRVEVLVDGPRPAGRHAVAWAGERLPAGVYHYLLQAGAFTAHRTMVLAR
jgi:hypothetical protein